MGDGVWNLTKSVIISGNCERQCNYVLVCLRIEKMGESILVVRLPLLSNILIYLKGISYRCRLGWLSFYAEWLCLNVFLCFL